MTKLSFIRAVLLFSSVASAKVYITVEPSGKTATIQYVTDGEHVRAFALDITVDQGVIVDINDFMRGESTKEKPGYGIFPANFARRITVNPDTGDVTPWDIKDYTPVADPCDPGALPKSGLGTYGITVEMGALYYPPDDSSINAPPTQGKLFKLILSEQAKLTIKLNEARGGIVLTNPDLTPEVNLAGATNISIAGMAEAVPTSSAEYAEWVAVGKPACWTFPRQCHGDAATGFYRVGPTNLNRLLESWLVKEPPAGPGVPRDCAANFKPLARFTGVRF